MYRELMRDLELRERAKTQMVSGSAVPRDTEPRKGGCRINARSIRNRPRCGDKPRRQAERSGSKGSLKRGPWRVWR